MKCWNWPASARLDGAVLGRDDACRNGLREREGTADGLDPVAHLRGVGVAQLDGGQWGTGLDLDDRQIGGLVGADDARRAAQVLCVRIGRELDVNLVGLLNHVIVGNDVSLWIDNEARAKRLPDGAIIPAFLVGHLAAEEAVEEVLEVALPLALLRFVGLVFVARILGNGLDAAMGVAAALVHRLLGQGLGVDIHHSRTDLLGDLHKLVGSDGGIDDLERCGVGAVALFFLSADPVSSKGTGHDGDRESSKQDKY